MHLNAAPIISTFSCSCTTALMVQEQQWLLPREAYFSHMFLTFIPSNGPICLSKCVCCVLFPARFVPMLSLQWAPFSPGVRTEASRYLYRLNSWGPPSQRRVGERNYHGGFRLNQALDNSLCSFLSLFFKPSFFLFFFLKFRFLAIIFLLCVQRGHFRSCSFRVSTLCLVCHVMTYLFLFTPPLMVSAHFPLWNAFPNKELAGLDR